MEEGTPAWSAAWTAAATSCAVSASMTMFRRSSTRRTTSPARGSASCGLVAAGEGPVTSGSVTPGTVKEKVVISLLDTPDLQRLYDDHRAAPDRPGGSAGDHVVNPSIYNTRGIPGDNVPLPAVRHTVLGLVSGQAGLGGRRRRQRSRK